MRAPGVARLSGLPLPLVGKSKPPAGEAIFAGERLLVSAARAALMVFAFFVSANSMRLRLAPRLWLTFRMRRAYCP